MNSRRFNTLIVLTCFLAGCASWAAHGVDYSSSRKLRIAVLPVRSEVQTEKLQNIESVTDSEKKQADQALLVRQQMQTVTEDMTRAIEARLSENPAIEVVSHERVEAMLVSLGLPTAKPLTDNLEKTVEKHLQK